MAERISPIIAHRRVDKIATYLGLSAHGTPRTGGSDIDRTVLTSSSNTYIAIDDVLAAVCGPENNPAILYFFHTYGSSPLLVNRFMTVWEQFHEPGQLAEAFHRSRRRIQWQIARIYRARNQLVHRGEQSPYIWRILQNAQYYVSSAISRVLHDLRDHPDWTVDTSLEHQLQRYEYVHSLLKTGQGKTLRYSDFLARITSKSDRLVWLP